MENEKGVNEFNTFGHNEINTINNSENNNLVISNLYEGKSIQAKPNIDKPKPPKEAKLSKFALQRMLSSFVVVCAMASVVQTSVEIPIFTELFHPETAQVTELTGQAKYFNSVSHHVIYDLSPTYNYIHVDLELNPAFTNFDYIFLVFTDLKGNILKDEIGEDVRTQTSLELLLAHAGNAEPPWLKTSPIKDIKVSFYGHSDDISQFDTTKSYSPDGTTKYYFMFEYDKVIHIE